MDISKRQNVEGVFRRFISLSEELETIIDNKKLGIANSEHDRWDKYDLEILEEGLRLIKKKQKIDLLKGIAEFITTFLFIIIEICSIGETLKNIPLVRTELIIVSLKIISIMTIPLLILVKVAYSQDLRETSLLQAIETEAIKMIRRGVRTIIGIIIFLDLINLFVGA